MDHLPQPFMLIPANCPFCSPEKELSALCLSADPGPQGVARITIVASLQSSSTCGFRHLVISVVNTIDRGGPLDDGTERGLGVEQSFPALGIIEVGPLHLATDHLPSSPVLWTVTVLAP